MNEFKVLALPAEELESQLPSLISDGWSIEAFSSPMSGQYAVLLRRKPRGKDAKR